MAMVKPEAARGMLLVVLSTMMSLLALEAFLKWRPQFQAPAQYERVVFCGASASRVREHDLFGWTEVPDNAYFEQQSEADGWAVHAYNSAGFRDLYDSGNENVIVLGDSFTRGTLVNNDETFPYLLDLWNPGLAFHDFGTGGYGTANSLVVYEAKASRLDHELVILAYYMGNDLNDNIRHHAKAAGAPENGATSKRPGSPWYEALKDLNRGLSHVRVYNLLFHAVRSPSARPGLSREQIEEGALATGALVSALAEAVRANDADLLIVALPSWNQIQNYSGVGKAARQRALLQGIADDWDNVHMLDLSDAIARAGPERVYGIRDKHFSRYGYYLAAKVIHDWINAEWHGAPRPARQAPPFSPHRPPVEPDCRLIEGYRAAFMHPERSRREAPPGSGPP
jgi:hypothetical protein